MVWRFLNRKKSPELEAGSEMALPFLLQISQGVGTITHNRLAGLLIEKGLFIREDVI
jgi:hypothetical protein